MVVPDTAGVVVLSTVAVVVPSTVAVVVPDTVAVAVAGTVLRGPPIEEVAAVTVTVESRTHRPIHQPTTWTVTPSASNESVRTNNHSYSRTCENRIRHSNVGYHSHKTRESVVEVSTGQILYSRK